MIAKIIGAVLRTMSCFYCGATFETDAEGWAHIQQCGYGK